MWIEIVELIGLYIAPILLFGIIIVIMIFIIWLFTQKEREYTLIGIYLTLCEILLIIIGLAILEKLGVI